MIVKCTECGLQVSDKAIQCPHCGYPFVKTTNIIKRPKKRMRLPNGFGRITELKNPNLRKRYRAMITVGKDKDGKPIGKLLKPTAYFATYNEAYEALVEYNKDPYDMNCEMSLEELYTKWLDRYSKTLQSQSSLRTIQSAWKHCEPLYKMPINSIKPGHIKENIISSSASISTRSRMKSVYNLMFDYAMEYDIVKYNPARAFNFNNNKSITEHIPFTDDEISILWNNLDQKYVNIIILQCYMGWRPQELGLIQLKDVNMERNGREYILGGIKTEVGTNRVVPIHPRILPIVQDLIEEAVCLDSEYLINCTDAHTHSKNSLKMTYDKYEYRFKNIIKELGLDNNHRPHDPRKHFVTTCKKYNVDEYAIKKIIGHKITDITEAIYTKRDYDWIFEELHKIEAP